MLKYSYYGHACFRLDDGKCKVLADPFLTGNPIASIKAEEAEADYILVTHAHGDHLGDAPSIAKRTGAGVVAIPEVLDLCTGQAGDLTVYPMNLGGTLELPFGSVRMVPAQHSSGVAGGIACGYVVRIGGRVIYFAGDTSLFGDMRLIGERDHIDYAILPIGDNYTMGPEDAARAASLLGAAHVIPIHYNTWPVISQDAAKFKELAEREAGVSVHIAAPGETLELA